MPENIIIQKTADFSVRIVNLYKYLQREKKEYSLSKQLLRCGTSIGANVAEAQYGHSKADFHSKMRIALKEAGEANHWIQLLYTTQYLTKREYESLNKDLTEILKILAAICKTTANQ